MGYMSAIDMAEHADDIVRAISWHLTANHYPPVPTSMVPVCIAAIDALNEEDPDRLVDLPEGILWRDHDYAPAWAIAEAHHLEPWLSEIDL